MRLEELKSECDRIVGLPSTVSDAQGIGKSFDYHTSTGLPLFSVLVTEFENDRGWMVEDILQVDRVGEGWEQLRRAGRPY